MPNTTFPYRPSRNADPGQVAWTVWQMLLYFSSSVYDVFQNKFAQGQAVMNAGATSVTVSFTAPATTYQVVVTPLSDPGGRVWVSAKTSTSFVINSSAAPAANCTYDYFVKAP